MDKKRINEIVINTIKDYCELNEIEDINAFANRCLSQGFNIVKFGISPKDNVERETNGIKDIKKTNGKKEVDIKGVEEQPTIEREESTTVKKEESKPTEERKENVTVRKIRIIKKQ